MKTTLITLLLAGAIFAGAPKLKAHVDEWGDTLNWLVSMSQTTDEGEELILAAHDGFFAIGLEVELLEEIHYKIYYKVGGERKYVQALCTSVYEEIGTSILMVQDREAEELLKDFKAFQSCKIGYEDEYGDMIVVDVDLTGFTRLYALMVQKNKALKAKK